MKYKIKKSGHLQYNRSQNKDIRREKTDYVKARTNDTKIVFAARWILKKHITAFKKLAK
jgi:hypothetical protein